MKASMIFYASWKEALQGQPDSVRLEVYEAAIDFAMSGEEPALSGSAALAFSFIRQDIIRDREKYNSICEKRRNAGRLGGAPKGNQNARKDSQEVEEKNNQNNQMVSKTTKTTQNNPNDNEDDNDNVNDNDSTKRIVSDDTIRESGPLSPVTPPIDINELAKFFNSEMKKAGALIPTIKTISGQRKTHTLARIREYGKETFAQMIRMAAESDFMNGRNTKGWTANYDWLIKPENFVKVIEGNYKNRQHGSRTQFDSGAGQEGTGGSGYDSTL